MSKLLTNLLKATGIVALVYYIYLMFRAAKAFDWSEKFLKKSAEEMDL